MQQQNKKLSLIDLKQDYHELSEGPYFCWWYNQAQFGYNIGDDTYRYLGTIMRREERAILCLDDYQHSTIMSMQDIGPWSRMNGLRALQIIQEKVEQLEGVGVVKQGQMTLF